MKKAKGSAKRHKQMMELAEERKSLAAVMWSFLKGHIGMRQQKMYMVR